MNKSLKLFYKFPGKRKIFSYKYNNNIFVCVCVHYKVTGECDKVCKQLKPIRIQGADL